MWNLIKSFENQDELHPPVTHHLPTLILFPYIIITSLLNVIVLPCCVSFNKLCSRKSTINYDRAVMILGVSKLFKLCDLEFLDNKQSDRLLP